MGDNKELDIEQYARNAIPQNPTPATLADVSRVYAVARNLVGALLREYDVQIDVTKHAVIRSVLRAEIAARLNGAPAELRERCMSICFQDAVKARAGEPTEDARRIAAHEAHELASDLTGAFDTESLRFLNQAELDRRERIRVEAEERAAALAAEKTAAKKAAAEKAAAEKVAAENAAAPKKRR